MTKKIINEVLLPETKHISKRNVLDNYISKYKYSDTTKNNGSMSCKQQRQINIFLALIFFPLGQIYSVVLTWIEIHFVGCEGRVVVMGKWGLQNPYDLPHNDQVGGYVGWVGNLDGMLISGHFS
jgi:hypothetical protein